MRNLISIVTAAALITGVLTLALALALCAVTGWPVVYAFIAGAGAALFTWLVLLNRTADALEAVNHIRKPPPPPHDPTPKNATVNLRIHEGDEYLTGQFLDIPVSQSVLAALAGHALRGDTLSTSAITGYGISRRTWEAVRDKFVRAGLLAWRGDRRGGVVVTSRGQRVFERLATPYSHHSPTGADALHPLQNADETWHTRGAQERRKYD